MRQTVAAKYISVLVPGCPGVYRHRRTETESNTRRQCGCPAPKVAMLDYDMPVAPRPMSAGPCAQEPYKADTQAFSAGAWEVRTSYTASQEIKSRPELNPSWPYAWPQAINHCSAHTINPYYQGLLMPAMLKLSFW